MSFDFYGENKRIQISQIWLRPLAFFQQKTSFKSSKGGEKVKKQRKHDGENFRLKKYNSVIFFFMWLDSACMSSSSRVGLWLFGNYTVWYCCRTRARNIKTVRKIVTTSTMWPSNSRFVRLRVRVRLSYIFYFFPCHYVCGFVNSHLMGIKVRDLYIFIKPSCLHVL